jgi:hypothetical protein
MHSCRPGGNFKGSSPYVYQSPVHHAAPEAVSIEVDGKVMGRASFAVLDGRLCMVYGGLADQDMVR